jgi:hypothetical protein
MAKKAVDSTLRRILNYTAEIIISIILLVTICIPLAFTIPMWFQHVFFNIPRTELAINPAEWWGLDGTLWVTLFLGLVSLTIGYLYIIKMNPGVASDDDDDDSDEYDEGEDEDMEEESSDDESEETVADVIDEVSDDDVPLEDQEADVDIPLEDQEAEEEDSDLDKIEDSLEKGSEED